MRKKGSLLGLLLFVLLSVPAGAQDFDDGMAAYRGGDFQRALREWRPLAEQGHAEAQRNLGVMYLNGQGVPQDYTATANWFQLAAEQGEPFSQFSLGAVYTQGRGVPQDYVRDQIFQQEEPS